MKNILLWVILSTPISFLACAQKLPNTQKTSLKAPENVKINGKLSQWSDQLQAYNHATNIFYTIANDDKNLYLIIQAKDKEICKKIIGGGISISIDHTVKKDDKFPVTITSPLLDDVTITHIGSNIGDISNIPRDSPKRIKLADSLLNQMNSTLAAGAKEIKITGIAEFPDSVVSVYNDRGIKVVMRFNDQFALNYQLAIPLKYLGLSADRIAYHITLNDIETPGNTVYYQNDPHGVASVSSIPSGLTGHSNSQTLLYATDFWAEYTLAGK